MISVLWIDDPSDMMPDEDGYPEMRIEDTPDGSYSIYREVLGERRHFPVDLTTNGVTPYYTMCDELFVAGDIVTGYLNGSLALSTEKPIIEKVLGGFDTAFIRAVGEEALL